MSRRLDYIAPTLFFIVGYGLLAAYSLWGAA